MTTRWKLGENVYKIASGADFFFYICVEKHTILLKSQYIHC